MECPSVQTGIAKQYRGKFPGNLVSAQIRQAVYFNVRFLQGLKSAMQAGIIKQNLTGKGADSRRLGGRDREFEALVDSFCGGELTVWTYVKDDDPVEDFVGPLTIRQ
jgi:hypothetical protein